MGGRCHCGHHVANNEHSLFFPLTRLSWCHGHRRESSLSLQVDGRTKLLFCFVVQSWHRMRNLGVANTEQETWVEKGWGSTPSGRNQPMVPAMNRNGDDDNNNNKQRQQKLFPPPPCPFSIKLLGYNEFSKTIASPTETSRLVVAMVPDVLYFFPKSKWSPMDIFRDWWPLLF